MIILGTKNHINKFNGVLMIYVMLLHWKRLFKEVKYNAKFKDSLLIWKKKYKLMKKKIGDRDP